MNAQGDRVLQFKGKRIAVLGDLVADLYITGTTSRISREAPVMIVKEEGREMRPGGGANVVNNLRALGGVPVPVGLLGDDAPGLELLQRFKGWGISSAGILVDEDRFTTTKTRVLAGGQNTVRQQMLRIDRLCDAPPSREVQEELVARLRKAVEGAAALVVSDYGEGVLSELVLQEVLSLSERRLLPIFVDSRFRIHEFRGVEALTPNEPELSAAAGMDLCSEEALEKAGRRLIEKTNCQALLVKRGRNGMALFLRDRPVLKIQAYGLAEVADVTGAGDTVISAFALARAAGASFEESMHLSNLAGGIKVTKSGTAVVEAEELSRAVMGMV
jgi:D-glycero-beta-D-manno-heptose-7-phosphate kinase